MSIDPNPPPEAANWRKLADGLGELLPNGEAVLIDLGNGRQHAVHVVHQDIAWELSGMVATPQELELADVSAIDLWRQNAQRCLTGYVVDDDGNVWVTALAPVAGLTAEEFGWLAKLVASEAERLEYRLTGEDTR